MGKKRVAMVFEYCPRTLETALESQDDPWEAEPGKVFVHQAKVEEGGTVVSASTKNKTVR